MRMKVSRRTLLGGGAAAAFGLTGLARAAVKQAGDLPRIAIPPAIGSAERLQR